MGAKPTRLSNRIDAGSGQRRLVGSQDREERETNACPPHPPPLPPFSDLVCRLMRRMRGLFCWLQLTTQRSTQK